MKIRKNKYVYINYTLKDLTGNVISTTLNHKPYGYLHGYCIIIPGLEKRLEGRDDGDKFNCIIPPKEAFGEYNPKYIKNIPLSQFESIYPVSMGMSFSIMTNTGYKAVKILSVRHNIVKVDENHRLAGITLNCDVEVVKVRNPTFCELARVYTL